jgi:hypothetical protein
MGVTGGPLFSLKGWNKKAQGNALGTKKQPPWSPERAQQTLGCTIVAPFQG